MGFLGIDGASDLTPDFVDDGLAAVGGALEDLGGYAVSGLGFVASLHVKTVEGLWDLAEDGFDMVMGAVGECMERLWALVPEGIREPIGDPDPLRQAAAAWRAVVTGIDATRDDLVAGGRTLHQWRGPAADRFDDFLNGLLRDSRKLSDGIDRIAEALTQAADALADLNRLVLSVMAEIAAYITVDVILTLLTGGGGAAAAAVQVSLLVTRVTNAIRKAIAIVRRVLPALREARALQALTRVTFKVDDFFVGKANPRKVGDLLRKWGSTGAGGAVGVSISTGRHPGDWQAKDWISAVGGTVASVKLGDALKPFWNKRTKRGSDSLLASGVNGALGSGATSAAAQLPGVVKGDGFSLAAVGQSAATGGAVSGGSRAGTFRVKDGTWRGAPGTTLSERDKGLARLPDGLVKGGIREPLTPDGEKPIRLGGKTPGIDGMPPRPFGRPSYTVRPGDDLTTIAAALLGDGNRWPELLGPINPAIADPDLIRPGQTIRLPR